MGSQPFNAASNLEAGDKNAPGHKNDEDTRHPSSLTIGAVPDVQRFDPSLLAGEEGDVEPIYVGPHSLIALWWPFHIVA